MDAKLALYDKECEKLNQAERVLILCGTPETKDPNTTSINAIYSEYKKCFSINIDTMANANCTADIYLPEFILPKKYFHTIVIEYCAYDHNLDVLLNKCNKALVPNGFLIIPPYYQLAISLLYKYTNFDITFKLLIDITKAGDIDNFYKKLRQISIIDRFIPFFGFKLNKKIKNLIICQKQLEYEWPLKYQPSDFGKIPLHAHNVLFSKL
jgi:hypothetical protein